MEGSRHYDDKERFFLGILSASFVVFPPLWASLSICKMGIIAFFFFCRNKVLCERICHVVISHKRVTIIGLSIIFIFKYFTLICLSVMRFLPNSSTRKWSWYCKIYFPCSVLTCHCHFALFWTPWSVSQKERWFLLALVSLRLPLGIHQLQSYNMVSWPRRPLAPLQGSLPCAPALT